MLKLIITAPGKHKVELECQPSDTFADVKAGVQRALGVPPDKQRLLCNGKERKDAKETLVAAGITAKSKLMLMLAPGYTMPVVPAADSVDSTPAAPSADDGAAALPADIEGELPRPDGVVACRCFHRAHPTGPAALPCQSSTRPGSCHLWRTSGLYCFRAFGAKGYSFY